MPRKILFIITQGQWGGAQRHVFDLATNLAKDFDVAVAVGEPNGPQELQKKLKEKNIPTIQLKHLVRPISPFHDILAIFELSKLYKTKKPDIAHLHSTKAGILGSIAKLLTPLRLVYTVHGWVFHEPMSALKRTLYINLEKITAKLKDKIIVLSEKDRSTSRNILNISENKLAIIPNGLAPTEQKYSQEEARAILREKIKYNIPKKSIWFGSIANFYKTKGLDILLDAIIAQKNKLPNAHFVLIGDGPEKNNLQNIIEKNNLQNSIHFTSWLKNAEYFLPALDCFILPSRKEGYPYAILEAISTKIPIISSSVGGVPEIIEDKKTGILVEKENARSLSEAIIFALNNPNVIKIYAEKAFEDINKYSLEQQLKKTSNCYLSLPQ